MEYGKTLSVPSETPLTKNWMLATTPVDDEAVARIVVVALAETVAALAGEVIEVVGAVPAETETAVEVAETLELSVAVAVSE